jgi:UDP-glucose 4-epimerase
MRKKIIVTGGLGYIGSHTCVSLYLSGYEPIIIDNLSNSNIDVLKKIENILDNNIKFYKADCRKINELEEAISSEKNIEGVIHFAALKSVSDSVDNPLEYYDNNVTGLLNILKIIEKNNISRFVFSSSCTVYGIPDTFPVSEKEPLKEPISPYGWTKYIGEKIINQWSLKNKTNCILLRYFNPIGAHPSGLIGELPNGIPNNLVPYITQTASGTRDFLTIYGDSYDTPDGTCIRDFIHVCDLAEAHVCALSYNNKDVHPSFFNIGTGRGYSVKELVETFEIVNNLKVKTKIGEKRQGDIPKIWAATEKSNDVLGWRHKFSIEEALVDSWRWEKKLRNIK